MTKLHINIAQGIIDIEGEEQFVQSIFTAFKDTLLPLFRKAAPKQKDEGEGEEGADEGSGSVTPPRRARAKKKPTTSGDDSGSKASSTFAQRI